MMDLSDLHTHTTTSGHVYNSLCEVARSVSECGMHVFGCSDHAPAIPGTCHYYYFIDFKVIPRTPCGVRLMTGIEPNIMDYEGGVDLEQDLLQNLNYAIASLHHPCMESGTMTQNTNACLGVIKDPAIHVIGHPDDSRCPVDCSTLVSAVRGHKILLEANSSSLNPMSFHQGVRENCPKMLELCKYYKTPVIVDSDAHCEADSGDRTFAHTFLEEVNFPPELVVNTSPDLLAGYIPRLISVLVQPDDAGCDQAGKDAGNTTSAGDTAPVENTASAGGMGKRSIS